MSDSDKSLEIRIKIKDDPSGGKATEQQLDKVKAKTGEVTEATVKQTAANKDQKKSLDELIEAHNKRQQVEAKKPQPVHAPEAAKASVAKRVDDIQKEDKSLDALIGRYKQLEQARTAAAKQPAALTAEAQAQRAADFLKTKQAPMSDADIKRHDAIIAKAKEYQAEQDKILAKLTGIDDAGRRHQDRNRNAERTHAQTVENFENHQELNASKPNAFGTGGGKASSFGKMGNAAAGASKKMGGLSMAITRVARAMGLQGVRGGAQIFTAIGAAVTVAYIAYEKLSEVIKVIGDVATPAVEPLINAMEEVREKTYQAEAAQRAYFRELQRTINTPETEGEKARVRMTYIREAAQFEQDMAGQQHQRDLAGLEALEAAGLISHAEALRRKYSMDEEYNQRRLAAELKKQEDELQSKKGELDADKKEYAKKAPRLADAQNKQRGTQEKVETDKAKLEQTKKLREETRARIAELREKENEAQLDLQHYDITDPTHELRKAKLSAIQGQLRGEYATLDATDRAIPKETAKLHADEEENAKATEAMKELEGQVHSLAEAINKLNIEIGHDEASTKRHQEEAKAAAASTKKTKDAEIVAAKEKEEAAAGITVGSARSALRYNAQTRSIEFDPTKKDAEGRPVDPSQGRPLNPWEVGAQAQYNRSRYGAAAQAADGSEIDAGKYPAEVQPAVEQYKKHFTDYHNMVVGGFKENSREVINLKNEMARELAMIRYQMKGTFNK